MREITAYQCDYCNKHGKSKSHVKRHENRCFHNPVKRACVTCANKEQAEYRKISDAPLTFGMEIMYFKPICNAGFSLVEESEQGYKVRYKHDCPKWEEIKEPVEDFEL